MYRLAIIFYLRLHAYTSTEFLCYFHTELACAEDAVYSLILVQTSDPTDYLLY